MGQVEPGSATLSEVSFLLRGPKQEVLLLWGLRSLESTYTT